MTDEEGSDEPRDDEPRDDEAERRAARAEKRRRRAERRAKREAAADEARAENEAEGEAKAEGADAEKDGGAKKEAPKPLPGAGTPAGDTLRAAHRAFDAGDFAQVRTLCRELEPADDPKVREAAAELYTRTTVDPVQVVVMLACAAVLGAIVWVWVV